MVAVHVARDEEMAARAEVLVGVWVGGRTEEEVDGGGFVAVCVCVGVWMCGFGRGWVCVCV